MSVTRASNRASACGVGLGGILVLDISYRKIPQYYCLPRFLQKLMD